MEILKLITNTHIVVLSIFIITMVYFAFVLLPFCIVHYTLIRLLISSWLFVINQAMRETLFWVKAFFYFLHAT